MADAGDRWNAWYTKMRGDLCQAWGTAGVSTRTGAQLPALPADVAVALCARIAAKLGEVYIERAKKEQDAAGVFAGYSTLYSLLRRTGEEGGPTYEGGNKYDFDQHFFVEFRDSAKAYLAGYPAGIEDAASLTTQILIGTKQIPKVPPEARDATIRVIKTESFIGVVEHNKKLEPVARQWLQDTIRVYQKLIFAAANVVNQLVPGETKPHGRISANGANLVFAAIYSATTQIAIEHSIVDIDYSDALKAGGELIKEAAEVVIQTGAEAVGETAGWIAEQAGKAAGGAVGGFFDEVGIYGIVLATIAAYILLK